MDKLRLALVLPSVALVFAFAMAGTYGLEKLIFGPKASAVAFLWVNAIPIGVSVVIGSLVAPPQFRKRAAYSLVAAFSLGTVGILAWDIGHGRGLGALAILVAIAIGFDLFVAPFMLIFSAEREITAMGVAIAAIFTIAVAVVPVVLTLAVPQEWLLLYFLLWIIRIPKKAWKLIKGRYSYEKA